MNVLARAGVCWLVLACFSMTREGARILCKCCRAAYFIEICEVYYDVL